ncbi:hypothetical protein EV368DRAFT_69981 [Lentinula lateritia]|nr:hypothetical protein EV368DRAFT_69981 [Lentinula lateritia]
MNTRIFNQRVEARRARANASTTLPGRRLRGPAHGLLGDGSSQRRLTHGRLSATTSLRHSQVIKAKKKGASSHAQMVALQLPDLTESQDYPPFSSYGHDSPHNYTSSARYGAESDTDSDFEPISEDGASEKDAAKVVHEMKVIYQDFRTRRDRTQINNKYWAEQMDDMDYCWREKNGAPLPQTHGPDMLLEIVDIFVKQYLGQQTNISLLVWYDRVSSLSLPSVILLALPFEQSISITSYLEVLGRQGRDWRMLNACPPCQYRLQEDDKLDVRMIVTMDGNNSLRRVERKEVALQDVEKGGETLPQTSREHLDHRVGGGDYFASRSETTAWDEANWPHADELPAADSPATHVWEEGRCEDWWENMKDTNTAYDLAVGMRHGEKWRTAQRRRSVKSEVNKSQMDDWQCPLNSLAIWGMFLPVIGTMHGYAHERVCQLVFLMLYIVGMGLEDGEGCERYFSVTNSLAPITRYQSIFHRRQSVAEFAYYHDLQTYSNLSKFIYGNYKQALRIICSKHLVRSRMQESGISSPEVFYTWLVEEGEYLWNLCKTPPKETIEMEYFAKLDALQSCQRRLAEVRKAWIPYSATARDKTNTLETKHRNEQENERKLIADVQALEEHLEISSQWIEGSEQWLKAKKMVGEAEYQKALDKLEGLLAAMNAYNEAAAALRPSRRIIQWEEVLDLTFLSEFDLLRDSQHELHIKCTALEVNNPPLALQLQQHFQERIRFNALHRRRLFAIKKLPGFDPHNINYFRVGTYVGRQNSMAVDEVEESGDVWFEDANGGEDDEDDLNARWTTVVDTATAHAL